MVPLVVVVAERWLQSLSTFAIASKDLPAGPLGLPCSVESFDLPGLSWAVGPNGDMGGSQ